MLNYKNFISINEENNKFSNKKIKIIYHFTESIDSLFSILDSNSLLQGSSRYIQQYGLGYDNISFTWNPNLWDIEYVGDIKPRWSVRISLDYNKLSKNYNIKSFNYGIDEEMEEIIETDEIPNIIDYITEITLSNKESKSNINYLKEKYPNIKIKLVRRKR
jgi:hypothetical protein